jgi:hypothetical protein
VTQFNSGRAAPPLERRGGPRHTYIKKQNLHDLRDIFSWVYTERLLVGPLMLEPPARRVCVKEREKRHLGAFSLGGNAKDANYEVARPLVSLRYAPNERRKYADGYRLVHRSITHSH